MKNSNNNNDGLQKNIDYLPAKIISLIIIALGGVFYFLRSRSNGSIKSTAQQENTIINSNKRKDNDNDNENKNKKIKEVEDKKININKTATNIDNHTNEVEVEKNNTNKLVTDRDNNLDKKFTPVKKKEGEKTNFFSPIKNSETTDGVSDIFDNSFFSDGEDYKKDSSNDTLDNTNLSIINE